MLPEHLTPAMLAMMTPANLASSLSGGKWMRAPHLEMLSNSIVEAAMGREPRLAVDFPPRHGKSELISKWTPLWYLNLFPHKRIILASYGSDFSETWGRQVRNMAAEYESRLRFRLAGDSKAADRWNTTEGGGMFTTGAGGTMTGLGADLLIIDDPIKNMEEAQSEILREKMWDWFTSTALTRLEPGGSVIIVHTRWHEDDLIGRLLLSFPHIWKHLHFPAFAEEGDMLGRAPGDALWPERYPRQVLEAIREHSPYVFGALYQGDPRPKSGGIFAREQFEMVDSIPIGAKYRRFWDLAGSKTHKGSDPDYTVGILIAQLDTLYWIVDIARTRAEPARVEQFIHNTAIMDGRNVRIYIEQEPGSSGKFTLHNFQTRVLKDFSVFKFESTGNKESYADIAASRAEAGRIKMKRASWNMALFEELESFPRGRHDDMVDALSKCVASFERKAGWGMVKRRESA